MSKESKELHHSDARYPLNQPENPRKLDERILMKGQSVSRIILSEVYTESIR
jgi:hypothetical protein